MKKGIDAPLVPVLFVVVLGIIPAYNSHNPYNFIFPCCNGNYGDIIHSY